MKEFLTSKKFVFILIFIGIGLRLQHLLENRSFWLDEAYVAVMLSNLSFTDILQNKILMPSQPVTPPVFSILAKLGVVIFGNYELAFRLIPFIAGVVSIFLFYGLAKRILNDKIIPLAVALFSLGEYLIYYSAELKPYSFDLLIALILISLFLRISQKDLTLKNMFLLALAGGVAVWCSFPSVYVLAAGATTYLLSWMKSREISQLRSLGVIFIIWLLSFLIVYKTYLSPMLNNDFLIVSASHKFMPWPIFGWDSLRWTFVTILEIISNPLGVAFVIPGLLLVIIGAINQCKENNTHFYFLILPMVVCFLAAVMHKYPFYGRMVIFIVPGLVVFLCQGFSAVVSKSGRYSSVVAVGLLVMIFFQPIKANVYSFVEGREHEEARQIMKIVKENYKPGDMVYMNNSSQFAYIYYLDSINAKVKIPANFYKNQDGQMLYYREIGLISDEVDYDKNGIPFVYLSYDKYLFTAQDQFTGRVEFMEELARVSENDTLVKFPSRTWLILIHDKPDLEDFLLKLFERNGKKSGEWLKKKASAYFFEK